MFSGFTFLTMKLADTTAVKGGSHTSLFANLRNMMTGSAELLQLASVSLDNVAVQSLNQSADKIYFYIEIYYPILLKAFPTELRLSLAEKVRWISSINSLVLAVSEWLPYKTLTS